MKGHSPGRRAPGCDRRRGDRRDGYVADLLQGRGRAPSSDRGYAAHHRFAVQHDEPGRRRWPQGPAAHGVGGAAMRQQNAHRGCDRLRRRGQRPAGDVLQDEGFDVAPSKVRYYRVRRPGRPQERGRDPGPGRARLRSRRPRRRPAAILRRPAARSASPSRSRTRMAFPWSPAPRPASARRSESRAATAASPATAGSSPRTDPRAVRLTHRAQATSPEPRAFRPAPRRGVGMRKQKAKAGDEPRLSFNFRSVDRSDQNVTLAVNTNRLSHWNTPPEVPLAAPLPWQKPAGPPGARSRMSVSQ